MSTCYCEIRPDFQPATRVIATISISYPAIVTTTVDHLYVTGTIVRLEIPEACGMQQANNLTGTITVAGANSFTIDIDTREFDPFFVPPDVNTDPINGVPLYVNTCALVIPIGESNDILTAAVQNVLP